MKNLKCLICGNEELITVDTEISDFIMARISDGFESGKNMNRKTKLCFCPECTFAFYEYRISDEDSDRIYSGYRDKAYQRTREKYECWYTEKVNDAMNHDKTSLREQKRVINKIVRENVGHELRSALDYGGNEGYTFFKLLGTRRRYVYDISGVPARKGVIGISDLEELKKHSYDFIMCNHLFEHLADPIDVLGKIKELGGDDTVFYIEVPSENPFIKKNKFSISSNIDMLIDPVFDKIKLVKYYFQKRRAPYMAMHEHINFYTIKSMRALAENNGFEIIDIQENDEWTALGKKTVLSMLFRKTKENR